MTGSVLIVDDDPGFRSLAHRMLTEAGLSVVAEAADARSAVAAAARDRPGGILVDLRLPDRAGLELARELAALEWSPRILLTSSDPEAVALFDGRRDGLPFLAKEELPAAPLAALLGAEDG